MAKSSASISNVHIAMGLGAAVLIGAIIAFTVQSTMRVVTRGANASEDQAPPARTVPLHGSPTAAVIAQSRNAEALGAGFAEIAGAPPLQTIAEPNSSAPVLITEDPDAVDNFDKAFATGTKSVSMSSIRQADEEARSLRPCVSFNPQLKTGSQGAMFRCQANARAPNGPPPDATLPDNYHRIPTSCQR